MDEAVRLAASHHAHPNPRVGAVVLDREGAVAGRGAHQGPGHPHAEIVALSEAGESARGGTLLVTLEPCDHHGRTPPCTDAIIESGLVRVVVGAVDPDGRVAGRGIARLRDAGLSVTAGGHADRVEAIDPGYFRHRRTGRPRVTLKWASTLDGQVAAADGTSQWITSAATRRDAHLLRATADAVMVGAGTVRVDDPRLTVRLEGYDGPQPRAVVVAGSSPLPPTAAVFTRDPIVYSPSPRDLPGEVVVAGRDGRVDLDAVVADLGKREMLDLLVEGGPVLAHSLLEAGLVERVVVYLAAGLAGGVGRPAVAGTFPTMGAQTRLEISEVRRIGPDVRVDAEVALGEGG